MMDIFIGVGWTIFVYCLGFYLGKLVGKDSNDG